MHWRSGSGCPHPTLQPSSKVSPGWRGSTFRPAIPPTPYLSMSEPFQLLRKPEARMFPSSRRRSTISPRPTKILAELLTPKGRTCARLRSRRRLMAPTHRRLPPYSIIWPFSKRSKAGLMKPSGCKSDHCKSRRRRFLPTTRPWQPASSTLASYTRKWGASPRRKTFTSARWHSARS